MANRILLYLFGGTVNKGVFMNKRISKTSFYLQAAMTILLFTAFFFNAPVSAQNTAFTFQGKLSDGGAAANGQYDLRFTLYDVPSGGTALGASTLEDVTATNGIFTVRLDFGADVFYSGSGRFLEIGVRPGASTAAFTTINPRQELTAAPYSIESARAEKAGNAEKFAGLPPGSFLRSDVEQNFSGSKLIINPGSTLLVNGALVGDGSLLSSLNATQLTSGILPDARLSANVTRLDASQVFTGLNVFNGGMSGNAAGLSNLNASNIAAGTLSDARLSGNVPRLNAGNTFTAPNNNFTGQISANNLSVGGGLPVTKVLTASATLDFGSGNIFQQVLSVSVPGARVGDAVYLGVPANLLPNYPQGATTATRPYVFQAYVAAPDVVNVAWFYIQNPVDTPQNACELLPETATICFNPPPGAFRVVVFSFAP